MATINGVAVNFGFTGSAGGIAITGLSGVFLQSAEHEAQADVEIVRDGDGDEVIHAWHNQHEMARLEWVITGGTTIAAAITNTTLSNILPGAIIVITACANIPALIATSWEVQAGSRISGTNVDSKRISLSIKKCPGVTALIS